MTRKIIVTGAPRSGTTLLAGALHLHPLCGPKPLSLQNYLAGGADPSTFLREQGFGPMSPYQRELEAHDVWRRAFPTVGGFRDLNKRPGAFFSWYCPPGEVWRLLGADDLEEEEILLAKNPELVYALPALTAMEGVAIVVTIRRPVEIFASVYHYGMYSAPPIEGFFLATFEGMALFGRRLWDFLQLPLVYASDLAIVRHDDLVARPHETVRAVAAKLDLDPDGIPAIQAVPRPAEELLERRLPRILQRDLLDSMLNPHVEIYEKLAAEAVRP